ncbi:mitotic-spindle organizing gamma-tubulin ring associated-domain-containing protein [Hyaloraphidium curvatum]|nr:mitotic-spindle organizing gamma-tubulin ring associated-domain-containing protein [Hyaloraphidium curvatum]
MSRAGGMATTSAQLEQQTLAALFDISELLGCGLDRATLATCAQLCQCGVNPEGLAVVVRAMKAAGGAGQQGRGGQAGQAGHTGQARR